MKDLPALGTREDQRTEFKSAEALRTTAGRRRLLREIVGMLNSGGGSIWIGIGEAGGAATAYEPLASAEATHHVAALKDAVLDSIEPRLRLEDHLKVIDYAQGSGVVIRLQLENPRKTDHPFHVLDGASRDYCSRHDDRLRPMSLAEIEAYRSTRDPSASSDALESVLEPMRSHIRGTDESWLLIAGAMTPPPSQPLAWTRDVRQVIAHPPPELQHPMGWGFTCGPDELPRFGGERGATVDNYVLSHGREASGYRILRATRNGVWTFRTRLSHLQHGIPGNLSVDHVRAQHPGARGVLHPIALIETIVSLARLGSRLWTGPAANVRLIAFQCELLGIQDWLLPPHSSRQVGHLFVDRWMRSTERELESRAELEVDRFLSNQDQLAYRVIRGLYYGFGFADEGVIPCFPADRSRYERPI